MNRYGPFNWIFLILSSLVLLFLVAPLLGLFIQTGAKEFFETANDKEVQDSIWLTIWVSFSATFFFAIAAVPFAWLLARKSFPLKSIVQGIIDLPVVLPHTAAGIALLGFISRDGMLGKAADSVGLNLVNNPAGIALAMAFVSLPFFINSARDGFAAVPERLEKAALNLGASRIKSVLYSITSPGMEKHNYRICDDVCPWNERIWSCCYNCIPSYDRTCPYLRQVQLLRIDICAACCCIIYYSCSCCIYIIKASFRKKKNKYW